jgi:Peptidase family M28
MQVFQQDVPFLGNDAWKDLKKLNDVGYKVSGTVANEVVTANIIKNRIKEILSKANKVQTLEFDHQFVTGSYFLGLKPYGMGAVYRGVQNLIVRVEGNATRNAILLNCHFDSALGSPAANDDLANCAIMLETLSILSKRDSKNRHSVIFLFNGVEETSLRGSHGFITQHKWARDVKVVINLDAAGSGGKEMLFQHGPGNSWLLDHYRAIKRSPLAQVAGEEFFQKDNVPSDTDFRIFRDYGNVVGLDFAHIAKGYRFHTKFDHIDYLSLGGIQRTGENILTIVMSIANGYELDHPEVIFCDKFLIIYF